MEPVTLVHPDGKRQYVTSNPVELNDLTMGGGYKRLSDVNDKAEKSKPKNEEKPKQEEKKDDAPAPAVKDAGHTPSTDTAK